MAPLANVCRHGPPGPPAALVEANELVDDGVLDARHFRAFSCDNAIRLHGAANPTFFEGTAVEDYARSRLAASQEATSPAMQGPSKNM